MNLLLAQSEVPDLPTVGLSQVIAPYMFVFFFAFFITFAVTPLMRLLAVRNGIVDWPDLKRKNHLQPVAYLGGVAIFIGWLGGVALCYFYRPEAGGLSNADLRAMVSIILGAGAITLAGLLDDVYHISPRVKVGGQLIAAAAIASQDVGIRLVESAFGVLNIDIFPDPVIYTLGTIVVAVFVIGGCNAINLLDGLDGLAVGVSTIATSGFLLIAAIIAVRAHGVESENVASLLGDPLRIVMCIAILGALLGFLPYNFNPATIFMGDAGSQLLGYLCVTTILIFSDVPQKGLLLVTACLIVFSVPITDTCLAIFRRKIAGRSILAADDQHIHHILRRSGLSVRTSVLVLYAIAIVFAVLGCTMVWFDIRWRYMLAVFVVLYGFIMVSAYKYGLINVMLNAQTDDRIDSTSDRKVGGSAVHQDTGGEASQLK